MGMQGIRVGMLGIGVETWGIEVEMQGIRMQMWRNGSENESNQGENLRIRKEMINKKCGEG